MNRENRRRYDMLVRVRAFCADHRDIFDGTPHGPAMLADLEAAVTEVGDGFALQSSGRTAAHEGTSSRGTARAALRGSLVSIRRTSRLIGLDTAGIDERFPVRRNTSDRELVADAKAAVQHATPLTEAFVANALPAGVIRDLPAQIRALEDAIVQQTAGREMHVGAEAAVGAALTSGVKAVKTLDSIVLNRAQDPETRAIWRSARRIGPARLRGAAAVAPAADPKPATSPSTTSEPQPGSKAA